MRVLFRAKVRAVEELLQANDLNSIACGSINHRDVFIDHCLLDFFDAAFSGLFVSGLYKTAPYYSWHCWLSFYELQLRKMLACGVCVWLLRRDLNGLFKLSFRLTSVPKGFITQTETCVHELVLRIARNQLIELRYRFIVSLELQKNIAQSVEQNRMIRRVSLSSLQLGQRFVVAPLPGK